MFNRLGIFVTALLCSPCFGDSIPTVVANDLCRVIEFASARTHRISYEDLFHCHVVTNQNAADVTTLDQLTAEYRGLLCHAHENDNQRAFQRGNDNTNILAPRGLDPTYLGVLRTAYASHVSAARPEITSDGSVPKMSFQINFFRDSDPQCNGLSTRVNFTCSNIVYCGGSASGFVHQEVTPVSPTTGEPTSRPSQSPATQ